MRYTSQNEETEIVMDYFGHLKGTVLEIGANDGQTLSNSYDLIKAGWGAVLVEPSLVFSELEQLHMANPNVQCLNYAVGKEDGYLTLHQSGAHVRGGSDRALVSSAVLAETERWRKAGVQFTETKVPMISVEKLVKNWGKKGFDYISIDVEGMEWEILKQIDLNAVGCSVLCIEFNGNEDLRNIFANYCATYHMKEIARNRENIIFAR